jgi:heme/copper-type cytochrome/quinol oxidase subunit 2
MSAAVAVFLLCVVCCVIGHAVILYAAVRTRPELADAKVPRPKVAVEIVWAVIPVIVLAFLLTATWARVRDRGTPKPGVIMKVAR